VREITTHLWEKKAELLLLLFSLLIFLIILEVAVRYCLFSPACTIEAIKHPGIYADYNDDDFWYFIYLFDKRFIVEENYTAKTDQLDFYDIWMQ